jgi:glycosyltransferase involved in cell wall biosynthesis
VSLQGGEARGEFTSRPRALRHALGRVAHVVACATPLAASARAVLPALAKRITVVPNGVDPGRFAEGPPFAHPRPYVFAVGRLVRQKGFDVLVKAFARVTRTHPGVDLLLAGDGVERSSLEAAARVLGPDGPVRLLGEVDSPTVAALCRGALFVVCPSRWEGLPVVCLEAMASGRALVASHVDGIPDAVVHGESGLLVPSDDPGLLADAIVRLLDDDSARTEMGRAGRRRVVERFSWQQIAREYLAILESVVSPAQAADSIATTSAPRHPPA